MGDTGTGARIFRIARKVGVTALGGVLVVLGILLLPLPGPGSLVIVGGLAVLGTEYEWAKRAIYEVRGFLARRQRQVASWFRTRRPSATRAA